MPSVLIIDADSASRTLMKQILEDAGVVCLVLDNSAEAAHLTRLNCPDGVLLEIGASQEGITLARAIKAERPATKVVLIAGHGEEAYLDATGKTGADALLSKKELRQELLSTLRRVDGRAFRGLWNGRERRREGAGELPSPQERRHTPFGRGIAERARGSG
jgi:DNA-binding NarL/FixJ family response regulator